MKKQDNWMQKLLLWWFNLIWAIVYEKEERLIHILRNRYTFSGITEQDLFLRQKFLSESRDFYVKYGKFPEDYELQTLFTGKIKIFIFYLLSISSLIFLINSLIYFIIHFLT